MEDNKKLETKRIIIYLAITFIMTYAYCFGVVYPINNSANVRTELSAISGLLIAAVMFFPSIGVLLTRLITKEGFKNSWIRLNINENVKTILLAYFGPSILTFLGIIVYFLVFPSHFDPEFGFVAATLDMGVTNAEAFQMPLSMLVLSQALTGLFLGPAMNFITCFGEEWGWRGYLLPKMAEKLPAIPMLLINGLIWGLWHAPLTIVGHNYGVGYAGFPFTGILAMCLFCIVMGTFLSYVTLKTKSCIPAVLGHGAINGFAAIGMYFTKDGGNPFVGPAPTGVIGMIPFVIVAVAMVLNLKKK